MIGGFGLLFFLRWKKEVDLVFKVLEPLLKYRYKEVKKKWF
jgi:hypothetical protein